MEYCMYCGTDVLTSVRQCTQRRVQPDSNHLMHCRIISLPCTTHGDCTRSIQECATRHESRQLIVNTDPRPTMHDSWLIFQPVTITHKLHLPFCGLNTISQSTRNSKRTDAIFNSFCKTTGKLGNNKHSVIYVKLFNLNCSIILICCRFLMILMDTPMYDEEYLHGSTYTNPWPRWHI